ncbi:uncharacterized protein JN550_002725 [Neoarthrinium moseri]|uniref:uncharacterized protein n=1 Tax=Neoarthrinium moseri TaxID=1658444 RepID=UPI001FDCD192|nr:uncharacterized protein JN550_002725 [Neoarthrinium moseri]KAI1874146.1 hypothetical protein JN550_002725 [Neoarthrinium moseri]
MRADTFTLFALLSGVASSQSSGSPLPGGTGKYIVQFSETGSNKFRKRDGAPDTAGFYDILATKNADVKPALNFTSDVFHGSSFHVSANKTQATLDEISALPEVSNIWPVPIMSLPFVPAASDNDSSTTQKWDIHKMTNVDRLHDLGLFGAGVVVGIVDTGVDYTHPALGGGFGPGFKIEGGYDIVGDNYDVGGTPIPDDDPMDCAGHGTHVSGILAGQTDDFVGVAPEVRIRMYKVFGCSDSTDGDVIIEGFLRAFDDNVDVITASLGSSQGFADSALAVVASNIQATGVFVSIAAGNSGANGPFYTSDGGNGVKSTAVGSVQSPNYVAYQTLARSTSGETRQIPYLDSSGGQWKLNGSLQAVFVPDELEHDSCKSGFNAIPSDQVMVVPRGNCSWQLLDSSAWSKAKYVFWWNFENTPYEIPNRVLYDSVNQAAGFALISYDDGLWLVSQQESGNNVTFSFEIGGDDAIALPLNISAAGSMNTWSSWGPTYDGRMKPEISAPGGIILSTWPVSQGSWYTASGTSMATPYIAGIASLWLSLKGGRKVFGVEAGNIVHNQMIASGKTLINGDGSGNLSSVAQQGAGLVDAYKTVMYKTSIIPSNIDLNDTDHFSAKHTVEVINDSNDQVVYNVTHAPGVSFLSTGNPVYWVNQVPPYYSGKENAATVEIEPNMLIIPAHGRASFNLQFSQPSGLNATLLPVYGGNVYVDGSNGESTKVTYMGIKGSMYNEPVWQDNQPLYLSPAGGSMKANETYNFRSGYIPNVRFPMLWGTREWSFDLVSEDWTPLDWSYPPIDGQNKFSGSLVNYDVLNDIYNPFPIRSFPRNNGAFQINFAANFSSGVPIPDGRYKLLTRALKTFGDKSNFSDWQTRISPVFTNNNTF